MAEDAVARSLPYESRSFIPIARPRRRRFSTTSSADDAHGRFNYLPTMTRMENRACRGSARGGASTRRSSRGARRSPRGGDVHGGGPPDSCARRRKRSSPWACPRRASRSTSSTGTGPPTAADKGIHGGLCRCADPRATTLHAGYEDYAASVFWRSRPCSLVRAGRVVCTRICTSDIGRHESPLSAAVAVRPVELVDLDARLGHAHGEERFLAARTNRGRTRRQYTLRAVIVRAPRRGTARRRAASRRATARSMLSASCRR